MQVSCEKKKKSSEGNSLWKISVPLPHAKQGDLANEAPPPFA